MSLWLPVLCFAALAWDRRWMSDDGFINVRVVWHVLNGHGPVFNIGERVEAATSPLWIAVLVVARIPLWFLDPAWVAVLCGMALATMGLALAVLGARRWWAGLGRDAVVPAGAAVLVALPPLWDFASSGLETGLGFAWIGTCWWATAGRLGPHADHADHADHAHDGDNKDPGDLGGHSGDRALRAPYDPWWLPVLIGLGPLVRPDFAGFSIAFAIALAVTSTRGRAASARALAVGCALPFAYQVFRMGYYGLLVPNTALAKEARRSLWARGWLYLDVYLDANLLRLSVALVALAFVVTLMEAKASSRHLVVAAAPLVAGVAHALYVVRVGGDFMYARMLLPATFAVLCPLAALPVPTRRLRLLWAPLATAAAVAVLVGGFRRWEPGDDSMVLMAITDEREAWTNGSGRPNPVTLDDYEDYPFLRFTVGLPAPGTLIDPVGLQRVPAPAERPAVFLGPIGATGSQLMGTHIVDGWGLAEPIGSHLEADLRMRAGHEKPFPWVWAVGRFGRAPFPDPDAQAAKDALTCGRVDELVDAVSEPLSPDRFLRNLTGAVGRTRLRIPVDPQEARARFCPAPR